MEKILKLKLPVYTCPIHGELDKEDPSIITFFEGTDEEYIACVACVKTLLENNTPPCSKEYK